MAVALAAAQSVARSGKLARLDRSDPPRCVILGGAGLLGGGAPGRRARAVRASGRDAPAARMKLVIQRVSSAAGPRRWRNRRSDRPRSSRLSWAPRRATARAGGGGGAQGRGTACLRGRRGQDEPRPGRRRRKRPRRVPVHARRRICRAAGGRASNGRCRRTRPVRSTSISCRTLGCTASPSRPASSAR